MHRLFIIFALILNFISLSSLAADKTPAIRNVVLVHGAWAEGSSWSEVITRLQAQGMHVTAVQNSLGTFAEATKAAQWVLDRQEGPTILAGHSFGGTIISQVGGDPKVKGLVYVAARAPEANEDFVELTGKYPAAPVRAGVQTFDGLSLISEEAFMKHFANGVEKKTAQLLFATQVPTAMAVLAEKTTAAAWHQKPSWYAISKNDGAINPDLQRFMAKRINAQSIELSAGHLSMVSHAKEIADLIMQAARGANKQGHGKISSNK